MYYKKNKGSSSGAGCDSRPVVIVHDLLDFQVAESVKFRYRQYSLDKEDRAYLVYLILLIKYPIFPCGKIGYFLFNKCKMDKIGSFEEESFQLGGFVYEEQQSTKNGVNCFICVNGIGFTICIIPNHADVSVSKN